MARAAWLRGLPERWGLSDLVDETKGVTYFRRWGFSINEGQGPFCIHVEWFTIWWFFIYVCVFGKRVCFKWRNELAYLEACLQANMYWFDRCHNSNPHIQDDTDCTPGEWITKVDAWLEENEV